MAVSLLKLRSIAALVLSSAASVPAGLAAAPSDLCVAREGDVAVVRVGKSTLVVVDVDDGTLLQRVVLREQINAVDITPRGDLVAILAADGTLILWDWRATTLARSKPFGPIEITWEQSKALHTLSFAPGGERLFVGILAGEARVVARDGAVLGTLRGVRDLWLNASIAWSPSGDRLAYSDAKGLSIVDVHTLELLRSESGAPMQLRPISPIHCFEFHPSAPRIATGHRDARIRVTDLVTGAEVQVLEHDDPLWGPPPTKPVVGDSWELPSVGWIAHSRDGTRLAYTSVSAIHFGCFDLASGERVAFGPFSGGRAGTPATIVWGPGDRRAFYAFYGGSNTLPWVWFGAGRRYGEVSVPGGTPKFGAGTRGVFRSNGALRAIDGITCELGWRLDSKTLTQGKLQPQPN